jgi:hypothetical protein
MYGLKATLDSEPMGIGGIYNFVVVARYSTEIWKKGH